MKARTLTRALGVILSAALVIASPVFAHSPYYSGHVDHDYSYGGHVDHEYGAGWSGDHDYAYGGYGARGYARSPYYGGGSHADGYGHPSGVFGYWGKDARHHYWRGHHHHHWF
jgi:hypothetical protein